MNKQKCLEEVCQEFYNNAGDKFSFFAPVSEDEKEIKCLLNIDDFPNLAERMVEAGYHCTQVQNDAKMRRCAAWFEPMNDEA